MFGIWALTMLGVGLSVAVINEIMDDDPEDESSTEAVEAVETTQPPLQILSEKNQL